MCKSSNGSYTTVKSPRPSSDLFMSGSTLKGCRTMFRRLMVSDVAANSLVAWSSGTSACKRKSALIGDGFDGDPPTVKSERRLDNSKKNQGAQRKRVRVRAREGNFEDFERNLLSTVAFPDIYSERWYGPAVGDVDN